ncbi:MAG TPA: flavodoxin family protein [Chitinophagales bacterium]|nr:flavodoxin family protein [Chitinophagales bacterium]HMU98260.1 flavodoxin family protein [Chitinophagales bacterium]HMV01743.1 flavodoxin family protein [Chitinophagales bacterium]HMW94749.1 flavodoxin family protein [Chitinophagales bacterium]HMY42642.1 flavodoxin family protein [Chitinophagales bacterium]
MEKKHLLFIYHSQSGHTAQLIEKCKQGASKEEVEIRHLKAFDTTLEDVLWADGIVIGTPEYFGTMSGALKDFFDRTYDDAKKAEINKPYALIISAGNDGTGAERQVQSLTTSYTMKRVLDTIIVNETEFDSKLIDVEELGQTFAAGLALGIF